MDKLRSRSRTLPGWTATPRRIYRWWFREPSWYEHRFLGDGPAVQIHVVPSGTAEVERMLLLGDRFRSCPTDRDFYQRTKRELAAAQ